MYENESKKREIGNAASCAMWMHEEAKKVLMR